MLDATQLGAAYREGTLTPTAVTEAYLTAIEPGDVYRIVTSERALAQAKRATDLFAAGIDLGAMQGIPIALKDLVDTEGEVTAAGSRVLATREPAAWDAPVAARLDAAGAVFLGKTNMTELAFSGIGMNPHFGTPGCADDPERIPGGSSSGSAVAVADRLACIAVGTDTGGSVRIPSSFNGLVGLKTTDGALPTDGLQPLSTTLDTVGPMARTVADAWELYQALRAVPSERLPAVPDRMRFLAPETVVLDELAPEVQQAYDETIAGLEAMGHVVERRPLRQLASILDLYAEHGSFAAHEAFALYERMIDQHGDRMDPRVARRIVDVEHRPSYDYIRLGYAREKLQRETWEGVRGYHAILSPTVAILPPRIEDLAEDEAYFEANRLCLRNTMLFNFLGGPAATVPVARTDTGLSIGLMIATAPRQDAFALAVANAITTGAAGREDG